MYLACGTLRSHKSECVSWVLVYDFAGFRPHVDTSSCRRPHQTFTEGDMHYLRQWMASPDRTKDPCPSKDEWPCSNTRAGVSFGFLPYNRDRCSGGSEMVLPLATRVLGLIENPHLPGDHLA